ncbi:interleukin-6-like [Thunnus maccoyii]|uniref:interleukin-6-like n=1 Tax=Thunnus maccoyii TaxID=8240 RepID=UPI001C4A817C|nr:interleukin-6-like [Thunnus maccoyii]XP_042292074.1 interleukin-6-like [Thunnus maccoyii]
MTSMLNAYWFSAVILAALVLCATGAPVTDATTENPAGDPSGEEDVVASDELSDSQIWDSILGATKRHKKEFEVEFKNEMKYLFLEHYKTSSLPAGCPLSNFSKEACLHRLVSGLQTYKILLKHVEKEYPGSLILTEARYYISHLIDLIKGKMRHPERVSALTSSQEQQLLKELDNPNTFHRKMTAHCILRQLHYFLRDGKLALKKREMRMGSMANRDMAY